MIFGLGNQGSSIELQGQPLKLTTHLYINYRQKNIQSLTQHQFIFSLPSNYVAFFSDIHMFNSSKRKI